MFDPNHFGEGFHLPATITSVVSSTGCNHKTITVDLDGETITIAAEESTTMELCPNYKEMLVRAALCRLKAKGNTLSALNGKGLF